MLKFIRGKGQQPSAERQKLQKELFAFRKTIQHGFPNKPSALAWDPILRLVAIGTASGAMKVFGRPGVEFYGQHTNPDAIVTQLKFLPGAGRVVALCDDNSLHLWEINDSSLVEVKSAALEGKLKRISAICVEASGEHLLLGTEGGNVYLLNLKTFTTAENIIYQDLVMQNCPEDYKINPGAVEVVSEHPTDPNLILIGYNRGLMVVWDRQASRAKHTLISNQQLESICWHENGTEFTSSHNDGSYVTWHLGGIEKPSGPEPESPYGPYACKAITKILKRKTPNGEDLIVFAGGMPRSSYSDKNTVTVQQGEKHVAFEFTSRVIDFFTTTQIPEEHPPSKDTVDDAAASRPLRPFEIGFQSVQQTATALIVLAEEELVAIDLQGETWKMMPLPYLVSLHACAVTCTQLINNVSDDIYNNIVAAGHEQTKDLYSSAPWPITGGGLLCAKPGPDVSQGHQILLTGHEDGSVRFWDASGVSLRPLYKFTTTNLFSGEDITEELEQSHEGEEDWPPFKRVGVWDPYSDDPRLAVKKVTLCGLAGILLVAGTAGHVVLANMGAHLVNREIKVVLMNIVSDRDGFIWKGHDQLNVKNGPIKLSPGFQATSILQLHPPAAVTCAVIHSEWGIAAAGTAHGLTLFDYIRCRPVAHRCTLNPNDHSGAGDTPISRRKSFKKSLRESFRRLRKGRSQRRARPAQPDGTAPPASQTPPRKPVAPVVPPADSPDAVEAKPVERQIEARPVDDSFGSLVKTLYFARTFLISAQNSVPTLWAGTNNGTIYAFTISIPAPARREEDDVHCTLAKEIQLKHRAPVIGITVLDGASVPLPDPLEVERGVSPLPDASQPHRVLIVSEEQFKIFSLPSLKPYCKYKLTAHEGARVRRMAFGSFSCHIDGAKHTEVCLLCLTNLGDCLVLGVPELRRQLNAAAVRKEDITGISTLTFSKFGEALYLHSSSELQRITVSATKVTQARCYLSLPTWAREGETTEDANVSDSNVDASGQPLLNGDHKDDSVDEAAAGNHNVTASSGGLGDITVDSVKEHLVQSLARHAAGSPVADDVAAKLANINLQTSSVNQSSVIVKTTTLTTLNNTDSGPGTTEATTTTSTHHATATNTENSLLEHTREEGQITRVETSTVTVPAGTDPKTILEMFERTRTPLNAPLARSEENDTPIATEAH